MKLKTLKDMSFYNDGCLGRKDLRKEYLKQEAIKWINSEEIVVDTTYEPQVEGIKCVVIKKIQNIWIKHFFNITEEDLK